MPLTSKLYCVNAPSSNSKVTPGARMSPSSAGTVMSSTTVYVRAEKYPEMSPSMSTAIAVREMVNE